MKPRHAIHSPDIMQRNAHNQRVMSTAYEELLVYYYQRLRRVKFTVALLLGFWACSIFIEVLRLFGDP